MTSPIDYDALLALLDDIDAKCDSMAAQEKANGATTDGGA